MSAHPEIDDDTWIPAGDYFLKLDGDTIVARNAKGRVLKTIPAKLKKLPEFDKLEALRAFLSQHEQQCHDEVRRWFLSGLQIPLSVIIAAWPDPSWRKYFLDVVVTNGQVTGLLRDVSEAGLSVVDLDGETTGIEYSDSAVVSIPHPAVMVDLDEWREFAVELGVHQGLDQLFRDVYTKPADKDGQRAAVSAYSKGTYEKYAHLLGRGRGAGFAVKMGEVAVKVQENREMVTATLTVSGYDPSGTAWLGELNFSHNGRNLPLDKVGPTAWSEGIRMCEFIYSGRTVTQEST